MTLRLISAAHNSDLTDQMKGAIEVQLVGTGMVKSFKLIPQSLLDIKSFL